LRSTIQRVVRSLGAVSLAVAAVLATVGDASASAPGAAGRIAFTDDGLGGIPHIRTAEPDGSSPEWLTTAAESPFGDVDPAFSPGGTSLAFTRLRADGSGDIWLMRADGSGQRPLIKGDRDERQPAWSPGGSVIVFQARIGLDWELLALELDTGTTRRLTDNAWDDQQPAWSSDGSLIAFVSDEVLANGVFTMRPDGSDIRHVTGGFVSNQHEGHPDFHPTKLRIIYGTNHGSIEQNVAEIYLTRGSQPIATTTGVPESSPVYSPAANDDLASEPYAAYEFRIGGKDRIMIFRHYLGMSSELILDGDQRQPTWQPLPAFPLVDARFSSFQVDIHWAYAEGITVGCTVERFCPNDNVTRAQMAIFLDRALDLPSTTTDYFSDDNGKTGEASINRLAASGITGGCAAGKFCPTANVTRGQMAAFLARAFSLPTTTTDYFTDDESSTFEVSINRVAAAGITGGCGGTKYCPLNNVTRGQMAAFLHRALQ
jgi:hypothetical protein